MNATIKTTLNARAGLTVLGLFLLLSSAGSAWAASITLQGQNRGDTNTWSSVNLQNWRELDYIPCRVHFDAGSAGSQTITVIFPHRNGNVPGVENLSSFSTSANAMFVSPPVLSAPTNSGTWSYTFTVNVMNNSPADVFFFARLSAGAHLNTGSSLQLDGNPSGMGNLQIHKPAPGPGAPDLAVSKSGPASVPQGGTITYTLTYTNKATSNTAVGSQIIDIVPPQVSVVTSSLPANALLLGNTLTFDLNDVASQSGGQVSFQATVGLTTPVGTVVSNYSQILSSENDLNYSDNTSFWVTVVSLGCQSPTVTTNPTSKTVCPGMPVTFSVAASGTAPLSYFWRKGGASIPGANGSSYGISSVTAGDAGSYDVIVSNVCGTATSATASLVVNVPVSAVGPTSRTNCSGDTVVLSTVASGTGPLSYQWYKGASEVTGQTASSLTLSSITVADAATYSVVVSGACGSVTNNANLDVTAAPMITCVSDKNVELGSAWNFDAPTANYPITILSTVTNSAGFCGTTFEAIRTWVATDACSNAAACSQKVTVRDTTAPVVTGVSSETACQGSTATFNASSSESGLSYQWYKGTAILNGQIGNVLTLNNVQSGDAGTYSVTVTDACSNRTTNSATLTVNSSVTVNPLASQIVNPGSSVTFTATASGAGTLTYVWRKDGNVLAGQNGSSLVLNNVSDANGGAYTVNVTGTCGTASRSAALIVNLPPVVSIIEPTNKSVFIRGQQITIRVLAYDQEQEGLPLTAVTNVEFYASDTKIADFSGVFLGESVLPIVWSNAPVGTHDLWARATDNMGLSATSSIVTITVQQGPDMETTSAIRFNFQTGLFEETVRISNPTPYSFEAVGVLVYNLRTNEHVFNPSLVTNGVPVVAYVGNVPPGGSANITIKYYLTDTYSVPSPTLMPVGVSAVVPATVPGGEPVKIERARFVGDGTFAIQFHTETNYLYYVLYTENIGAQVWKTASETVVGNGQFGQWFDGGQPNTTSTPSSQAQRFYRVIRVPMSSSNNAFANLIAAILGL